MTVSGFIYMKAQRPLAFCPEEGSLRVAQKRTKLAAPQMLGSQVAEPCWAGVCKLRRMALWALFRVINSGFHEGEEK